MLYQDNKAHFLAITDSFISSTRENKREIFVQDKFRSLGGLDGCFFMVAPARYMLVFPFCSRFDSKQASINTITQRRSNTDILHNVFL